MTTDSPGTSGRVAGKVAVVTGCSMGQGRSHMLALAAEGARVLGIDVKESEGRELESELRAKGSSVEFLSGDVGAPRTWEEAVRRATELWGTIDILVNNAAVYGYEDYLSETLEGWDTIITTNQTSVFLGMKHVLPVMIEHGGGSIINICSNCGVTAIPGAAAYHAAKGAVRMMTKNAAVTYGAHNIRVNSIIPGLVLTALSEGDPFNDYMVQRAPLGRGGVPEDITPGVLFLASDESRFMTGSELTMDGGYLAL